MNDDTKQNLIDAGCTEDFIEEFDKCSCNKRRCEKMLAQHRRKLLDEIHSKERCISCLDYLVYRMQKEDLQ